MQPTKFQYAASCSAIVLLAWAFVSCGAPGPSLLVYGTGIPGGATVLEVFASIDMVAADQQPELSLPHDLNRDHYSFVLQLPSRAGGRMHVEVIARDVERCVLGAGSGELSLPVASDSSAFRMDIVLQPPTESGCHIELPILLQAMPERVSTKGGTLLTLKGVGFRPGATLRIGETDAAINGPDQLRAVTPRRPGQAGAASIGVTNPGGSEVQSNRLLSYFYGILSFEQTTHPLAIGTLTSALKVADLNGDGWPDLAALRQGQTTPMNWLITLMNRQNGTLALSSAHPMNDSVELAIADFNQDGLADIAAMPYQPSSSVYIYINQGDETFKSSSLIKNYGSASKLMTADFNHEKKSDLAWVEHDRDFKQNDIKIQLNQGQGLFATAQTMTAIGDISLGDFRSSGSLDFVGYDYPYLYFYSPQDDGTYPMMPVQSNRVFPSYGLLIPPIDLDGDGRPDPAIKSTAGPTVSLAFNSGGADFPNKLGSSRSSVGRPL